LFTKILNKNFSFNLTIFVGMIAVSKKIALTSLLILFLEVVLGQVNLQHFSREGRNAILKKNYTEAIENLNVVINRKEKPFEAYFLRGIAKYNLGDHHGALSDFNQTLEIHPFYVQAYHYRGVTYSALMEKSKAIQDLNRALEFVPYNADILMSRGAIYLQINDLDKALADLNKAVMIDEDLSQAYLNRAIVYKEQEQYLKALEDCNTVISINQFSTKGYAQRGLIKYEIGRYEAAMNDFNQAIGLSDKNSRYYYYRAITKYQLNDIEGTLADYSKVINLDPGNALTYYNRAIIYSQVKDYENAIADLSRVAQLNPNNVLTYFNRAHLYFEKGQYNKSINDYTKAINLFPGFARAYLMRASAKANQGDYKGARQDRRKGNQIIEKHNRGKAGGSSVNDWVDSTYFAKIIEFESEFRNAEAVGSKIEKGSMRIRPEGMFSFRLVKGIATKKGRINSFVSNFNMKNSFENPIALTNEDETKFNPDTLNQRLKKIDSLIASRAPSSDLYFLKGIINQVLQNYSTAMNAYSMALIQDKDYYPAYVNRAVANAKMKEKINSRQGEMQDVSLGSNSNFTETKQADIDYAEVIKDLNEALKIHPGASEIYLNKGNAHLQMKNYTHAVKDYTKAIDNDKDYAEAYYNRGLTLIYLQDRSRGCLDMSKAGELGIENAYNVISRYCNDN